MALHLESSVALGNGILLPDANEILVLDAGRLALDDPTLDFPPLFLSSLEGTSAFQTGFWLGDGSLSHGPGASAFFKNVQVRLGTGPGDRMGWFCRHSSSNPVVWASCLVDAAGASSARGVYAVDSPELVLENCTFANFRGDSVSYAIQGNL